jgi:hypothetical protein
MKRIGILALSGVLGLLAPAVASAASPTFEDCDSAYNYGSNTAQFYVSASMNRASCDNAVVTRAEVALGHSLRRQKIPPQNSEELKVCFYEGLYFGYVSALYQEHSNCGDSLSLLSVARAAVTVFSAMQSSLDQVDDGEVESVFGHLFYAPTSQGSSCEGFIRGEQVDAPGFGALVDAVCWNG